MNEFDPKLEHFNPYACWEAGCNYVDEHLFGSPDDEDFDEVLYCCAETDAPPGFTCPLLSCQK